MKIVTITSSPHRKGTTDALASAFCRGAEEAGHEVFRFDAARERVQPCLACDACRRTGACVQKDSMETLMPHLLEADVIAFVTPLYYYGMSAQLKTVVDRFYGKNSELSGGKRTVLLAASADDSDWTMAALERHYETILRYLGWEDAGRVLAMGCGDRAAIEQTDFPNQAFQIGKSL